MRRTPMRQLRQVAWLDHLLERFQHDWETNPRYRASATGVLGLLLVLTFCACTGSGTLALNAGLTRLGLGGIAGASGGDSSDTGTSNLKANNTFPTPTLPAQTPAAAPGVSPIPNSQTPVPSATVPATATPGPTATPTTPSGPPPTQPTGGGGGSSSVSASPTPWIAGKRGDVRVHAGANLGVNIIIKFPSGETVLNDGQGQTDGAGNYDFGVDVPAGATSGTAQVVVMIQGGGGATINQPCSR